ncbi:hypothetical protein [Archangium lipolyticum]|uniref:hypothetical protein n=1 Tax=Archangium lipolyticum TaxID=2970465 RepID=UPI00214A5A03|nr:hypothetical protein [Archangium lipolyticum]
MRASSFVAVTLLSAALSGCQGEDPGSTSGSDISYTDLPQRKTTVSGLVYDPEAFFFSMANWPGDPTQAPPPAFFNGNPHGMRAAPMGAHVSIVGDGTAADTSGPVPPTGAWQVLGVPTSDTTLYMARAEPPAEGVGIGAPNIFSPPDFTPIPVGKYYPTTALRPILARASSCQLQVAEMLGDLGGLAAVANMMTMMDMPTTPADLADPSKTGAVVFIWVYSPSPVLDIFNIPSDDFITAVEVSPNNVLQFGVGWAPPGAPEVPPSQGPMGYFAIPAPVSPLGYFALVIPKGTTGPVKLNFVDTKEDPKDELGPRPWRIPSVEIPVVPGVSFLRLHAQPGGPPPPDDVTSEPAPDPDTSWMCLPR